MTATTEFAPLTLPVSSVSEGLDHFYKIVTISGEVVKVQAQSAAEAIAKSGVVRPLRIISVAQEQRRLMERHVLHPGDKSVNTNIDTQNFVPDFRSLVVDNLEEEEKPPFEECSLADIAARKLDKLPEKPKPAPVSAPPPKVEITPLPRIEEHPEIIAIEKVPPPEQEIILPDQDLTPEQVEALMNAKITDAE